MDTKEHGQYMLYICKCPNVIKLNPLLANMWYIESVILNYIWRHDDIMQLQFVFFGRESSPFSTWPSLSFYIEEL